MRRRSTFKHDGWLDVAQHLQLSGERLIVRGLDSAREERLTFGFSKLPPELWQVLKQSHELHIRWASDQVYNTTAPFFTRISPGLHIYYTPLKNSAVDELCPLLHKVFSEELKCESLNQTFSTPTLVSSRFASSSSYQYHSLLSSLSHLVAYVQQKICLPTDKSCIHVASLLNIADYIDLDYDTISHALVFTAFWSRPPPTLLDPIRQVVTYNTWDVDVEASQGETVEVGVLHDSGYTDVPDLALGGFLTAVGEDDRPKPTEFSFPSRHHALPVGQARLQAYSVSFDRPTGLHPTLRISFRHSGIPLEPRSKLDGSTCALHTYLTLPSALFADPYQLTTTDELFLASHHLRALRSISGETDLEDPDYVVQKWGSNLLLELATPSMSSISQQQSPWHVTIPLHLRYLPPSESGYAQVKIPWPTLFWACTAEEGTKFPVNPFDRVNLGFDGLFGGRTMFYHLDPKPLNETSPLVETLDVPVLDMHSFAASWIELGTVLSILVGFSYVCWALWTGYSRRESSEKHLVKKTD